MSKPDLQALIDAIPLTTKAAKLRKLMPSIEAKLAEGVQAAQIVQTLKQGGLDITIGTFRNYLHQYRAKQTKPQKIHPPAPSATEIAITSDAATHPISIQALDCLMKPDPAQQAKDIAHYERIAKQKRNR